MPGRHFAFAVFGDGEHIGIGLLEHRVRTERRHLEVFSRREYWRRPAAPWQGAQFALYTLATGC